MSEQPRMCVVYLADTLIDWLAAYHASLGRRDGCDAPRHREAWEALTGEVWPEEMEESPTPEPPHTYCAICSPGPCRCEEDRR